ncbi:MAG: nitroreductase family deazaflavin-dependent oxidoreductase [Actinomycetota bacterium]
MALPKALARFNRVVTNRVLGLLAPWVPPFAMIEHRGRSSGREHRTPVWMFHRGGRYVVALTYGSDSDWVKNVFAAGGCLIRRLGMEFSVGPPRLVRARSGRGLVPGPIAVVLRAMGVHDFLLLEPA